jgi:hypothetical protein
MTHDTHHNDFQNDVSQNNVIQNDGTQNIYIQNDTQNNVIQYDDTQNNDIQNDIQHSETSMTMFSTTKLIITTLRIMTFVVMNVKNDTQHP